MSVSVTGTEIKVYPKDTFMMETGSPFGIVGPSEYLENKGKHLVITGEQARRVSKDPEVEGPKVFMDCVETGTIPAAAMTQDFVKQIREIRAEMDKEKADLLKPKKSEPKTPAIAPPVAVETEGTGNVEVDKVIATLQGMETVGEVKEYAKNTLGMPPFLGNPNKASVIAKISEHLLNPAEAE